MVSILCKTVDACYASIQSSVSVEIQFNELSLFLSFSSLDVCFPIVSTLL